MELRVEVASAGQLAPATLARVEAWTSTVFGPQKYVIADMGWRVLLWDGDELVSHVGLVRRTVTAGEEPIDVTGFGWVGTLAAWRGRSIGSAAMRHAATYMRDELRTEAGLLVCAARTAPFYRQLGWREAGGPLTFAQPGGPVTWPGVAMVLPGARPDWPAGAIDLRGLIW